MLSFGFLYQTKLITRFDSAESLHMKAKEIIENAKIEVFMVLF
jgi:hypothetical protein